MSAVAAALTLAVSPVAETATDTAQVQVGATISSYVDATVSGEMVEWTFMGVSQSEASEQVSFSFANGETLTAAFVEPFRVVDLSAGKERYLADRAVEDGPKPQLLARRFTHGQTQEDR